MRVDWEGTGGWTFDRRNTMGEARKCAIAGGHTRKTHIKTPVLDQERRKWFEYGAQGLRIATGTKRSSIVQDQVTVGGGRGMHMVAVSIASDSDGDSDSPRALYGDRHSLPISVGIWSCLFPANRNSSSGTSTQTAVQWVTQT